MFAARWLTGLAAVCAAACVASPVDLPDAATDAARADLPRDATPDLPRDRPTTPPPDAAPAMDTGVPDTGAAATDTGVVAPADTLRPPPDTGASPPVDSGPPPECSPGQSRPCGATVGACTAGTQPCEGGRWGACSGRGAGEERCHDGVDNDCDGAVDEGCPCPTGTTLSVDNDVAGSGYREETRNWATWSTDACRGTYRYLSHTVGDGSRRGRAIWQPTVRYTGFYRVVTSYRASENRTTDADYTLEDDAGTRRRRAVNQRTGDGCTRVDLGLAWCRVGGACRVVLDGEDGQSDSADETTFRLESCGAAPTPTPPTGCAAIAANPAYEVCFDGGDVCRGVYTDGSGCVAFCAAAGMVCTARYGGEPGCRREAVAIPCAASNGHASDWCECARR